MPWKQPARVPCPTTGAWAAMADYQFVAKRGPKARQVDAVRACQHVPS
jgi:hypothetical protein